MALFSSAVLRGPIASLPTDNTALTEGRLFFASDTGAELRDNGATWDTVGESGINQLTGDVTAGPGTGAQAASVVKVNGAAVPVSAAVVGTNSSNQIVAATSANVQTAIGSGVYDVSGAAATAQSNAETFAANASNLSSGTVAAARLPAGCAVVSTLSATPSAGGNFTMAHGLSSAPSRISILMTSGGAIWAQTPAFDGTNVYLVASDGGVTGDIVLYA